MISLHLQKKLYELAVLPTEQSPSHADREKPQEIMIDKSLQAILGHLKNIQYQHVVAIKTLETSQQ